MDTTDKDRSLLSRSALIAGSLLLVLVGCSSDGGGTSVADVLYVPTGFPVPRVPEDNVPTEAKRELGRHLFYDTKLSGNGQQSCASCHHQELAFTDGLMRTVGSTGETHPRNSPTLTNAAYNATLTWANPLLTDLERQLLTPIFGDAPIELGVSARADEVLARFANDERYRTWFEEAFPADANPVNWDNVVRALATFTRALNSGNSRFDQFVYGGEANALSASERRGMELFFSETLECHHCHGGFNFSDSSTHAGTSFGAARFHNTGLYNLDGNGAYPADNTGIFELTGQPEDMGRFRPPTLRNVAVTAPYMHDGSLETLEDVIRTYEAGGRLIEEGPLAGDGRRSPLKSGFVVGFTLTDEERTDLVHFLESLTDESFLTDPRLSDPFAESP